MPDEGFCFRIVLIVVARQNGNGLDADAEILTVRGFVTMRDIREGDEVYHPAGHRIRVTATSNIAPEDDCYRVTTTDGRSVIVGCDHLWEVRDKRRNRSAGPRGNVARWFEQAVMTTGEMAMAGVSRYAAGGRMSTTGGKRYATNEYRFMLPSQEPIKSPDLPLPIHPYVLGAWLGDGHTSAAMITSADPEVIEEIRKTGQPCLKRDRYAWVLSDGVRRGRGHGSETLSARLRALGVLGNKHVPGIYLTAGDRQRESLLQGLVDTDGSIDPRRGQVEFCSTLRPLADAALYLARSLGWRATLRTGRATLNGRDHGTKYRVFFTPKTCDPFCPVRLPGRSRGSRALTAARAAPHSASPRSSPYRRGRCAVFRSAHPTGYSWPGVT